MFFTFCAVFLTILGVFLGTLGFLKMSILSRRNTDFHVFYLRKCDVEIGTRTNTKKLGFWKDLGLHFCDFSLLKRVLKLSRKTTRKKMRKNVEVTVLGGLAGGMCGRRGETREGSEIQNCRILEKVIGKSFSNHHLSSLGLESSTLVPSLRSGRRSAARGPPARSSWRVKLDNE